ncbi:MAG: hypothetical protein AB8B60_06670 [Sulfitobacter sp.]
MLLRLMFLLPALTLSACGGDLLDPEARAATSRTEGCQSHAATRAGLSGQVSPDVTSFANGTHLLTYQANDGSTWNCVTDDSGAVQQFKRAS